MHIDIVKTYTDDNSVVGLNRNNSNLYKQPRR